ncbi:MAG: DNA polymerase III subunit gamma/tau [candidate division Zixibacteria bacterium]
MSYLALARRYRPNDFDGILSQNHITTTLKNAVASGRISHAYLLCGPRGTGKTTTARVLAKSLNCEKGPTPEPCGQCNVCKEITIGSSPDVFEIDAASNRGIDDIRELRENVRYSPVGGRYKIYIIDEVHRLTKEAFDALLKTLEEPPAHVIFIFATTEPQALPATILSRTQRYDFKRIPVSALADAVNKVAGEEGLTIEPGAALLVAKKADGSFRDALSLLDQLSSFSDSAIDVARTAEILGLVKTELLHDLTQSIITRDAPGTLAKLGEFIKSGGDAMELAEALSTYLRALLLIKNGVDDIEQLELDKTEFEVAGQMVADIDIVDLLRYFTVLADYRSLVRQGLDPIYSFETSMVKMASMDRAMSLEELFKSSRSISNNVSQRPRFGISPKPKVENNRKSFPAEIPDFNETPSNSGSADILPADDEPTAPSREFDGEIDIELISKEWGNFGKFVSKKDKTIFAYTAMCKPAEYNNGVLTVNVNNGAKFQYDQLSQHSKKAAFESYLKEFFSREINLELVLSAAEPGKSNNDIYGPDKIFEESPGVKKLFDQLGGEIIGQ